MLRVCFDPQTDWNCKKEQKTRNVKRVCGGGGGKKDLSKERRGGEGRSNCKRETVVGKKMTEGRERVWPLGAESFVRWCCEVTRVAGVEITYKLDSSCSESQQTLHPCTALAV